LPEGEVVHVKPLEAQRGRLHPERETHTAQVLLDEVTYPIMMHPIIDDRARFKDPLVNGLFVPRKEFSFGPALARPATAAPSTPSAGASTGWIQTLPSGYGFIVPDPGGPNMFFFHEDVFDVDFLDLKCGDRVQYVLGQNDRGACATEVRRLAPAIS